MLNNNFLVGTSASEVYGACKYLPSIRLFKSKVFICPRIII